MFGGAISCSKAGGEKLTAAKSANDCEGEEEVCTLLLARIADEAVAVCGGVF